MRVPLRWLILFALFVCPLIFFTDLTRNPYFTQIALLNIALWAAGALALIGQASSGELVVPRTPLDFPLACWAGLCALSWTLAYFGHAPFFRGSIRSEGSRAALFLAANTLLPFLLAGLHAQDCPEESGIPIGRWALFSGLFGLMWTFFPQMRSPVSSLNGIWDHVWDPYGALLWIGGLAGMLALARGGSVHHFWHTALCVGFLSSAYGVAQYFNLEFLWPKALDPYGGRSVSTFGNPNFMSSYIVMLLPLAAVYFLQARERLSRAIYALLFLTLEAGLLCSLTRSSWLGAAVAFCPLAFSPSARRRIREAPEETGSLACAALAMALLWPPSNIAAGYTSSVLGRIAETTQLLHRTGGSYSPWHQRNLIWLCCWLMGAENPLLGKGWGLLELFYPFYQGHILSTFDFFSSMRTHANNAHNEVVEVWAQTGLLGVGILVWTWTVFFAGVRDQARSDRGAPWMLAAAGGVLGMLADNLLNVSLHFAVPGMFFWWQVGTVLGYQAHRQGWRRRLTLPSKGAAAGLGALAAAAALGGSWLWVCQWNREAYYFLGFKAMRRGNIPSAVDLLRTAYDWQGSEVNADYELGNAYARAEQFEKAEWAYTRALNANAGYDEIYYNRGVILEGKLGRKDEALKDFLTARAINPLSSPMYEHLSRYYLNDPGRYRADGIELLERAVHFFPEDLNFANNLAWLYSVGKEYAKAEEVYGRILSSRPNFTLAETNLRASLRQSGNAPGPLLARLDRFHELEGRIRAKDLGLKTLELARRVSADFPEFPGGWFYLGNLELQNGDAAQSEVHLRRYTEADPASVPAVLNLAEAYRRQGKQEEFISALRAALARDPSNSYAASQLRALGQIR